MGVINICVVSGGRADFGLLSGLIQELECDRDVHIKLITSGAHSSKDFGLGFERFAEEGFKVTKHIEVLLKSDSNIAISKSTGLAIIGFAEFFADYSFDIIILLGDRYEILAAAIAALLAQIPIAHIHGGEVTMGAIDDPIRHAITKMSHLHFVANEDAKRRVIQLGEAPDRVFNVGALGLENFKRTVLWSRADVEKILGYKLGACTILITYHSETMELSNSSIVFGNLLKAISRLEDVTLIFTLPNADPGNQEIRNQIIEFCRVRDNANYYAELGQKLYFSVMRYSKLVLGNSSSGIIEAPTVGIPTVNIGRRQEGRLQCASIINCGITEDEIFSAILRALSSEHSTLVSQSKNPYDASDTASKIRKTIKLLLPTLKFRKTFFDT